MNNLEREISLVNLSFPTHTFKSPLLSCCGSCFVTTSLRPHPRSVGPRVRPGTIQQRLDSIGGLLLSQLFFVAKIFTCTPGKFVNSVTIISDFNEELSGKRGVIPEAAFYMVKSLANVKEKAASLPWPLRNETLLRKFGFWSYLCCLLRCKSCLFLVFQSG